MLLILIGGWLAADISISIWGGTRRAVDTYNVLVLIG